MTAYYFSGGALIRTVVIKEKFFEIRESPEDTYVLIKNSWLTTNDGWYRHDITPVLLENVPKEYLLLSLLLT